MSLIGFIFKLLFTIVKILLAIGVPKEKNLSKSRC
jgi:hypothetical protein